MLHDLRLALRSLVKSPAFSLVAIVTLALGIGVNTAIFSVVHSVALAPLAYHQPDRLVAVWSENVQKGNRSGLSPAGFRELEKQFSSADSLAASYYYYYNLTGVEKPTQLTGGQVTQDYFKVFGVQPMIGRTFLPEDAQASAKPTVVLSHTLWHDQLGARREAVGETILLDDVAHIVVGVMPASFKEPFGSQALWKVVPNEGGENLGNSARYWGVTGRLKPTATPTTANAELATISARFANDDPNFNRGWEIKVTPLRDFVIGDYSRGFALVIGAALLVLLMTCANVAGLQLVRASTRQREIAVCMAVGASRWMIIRRQLAESALLAAAGTIAGVLVGQWGLDALLAGFAPGWLPRGDEISLNSTALAISITGALFAGFAAGVLPALHSAKADVGDALKAGGKGTATGGAVRLRSALVIAQIATTIVVLTCAGLIGKSFASIMSVNPGLRTENTLSMVLSLSGGRYDTSAKQIDFFAKALERVRALPGIENAAFTQTMPFTWGIPANFIVEGRPADAEPLPSPFYDSVSPTFFQTMSIPLLAGRFFNESDDAQAPRAVIISKSTAERFFPNQDPLGQRLLSATSKTPVALTVVGVVGDVTRNGLTSKSPFQVYASLQQRGFAFATLLVRSPLPVETFAPSIQRAIWSLDPEQPISNVTTVGKIVKNSLTQPQLYVVLFSSFAILALLLAAIGLYGLISYSVEQRTREFGIRTALGAQTADVLRLVLEQGLKLTGLGLLLGLAGAAGAVQLMQSLLFKTGAYDPLVFAGVVLALTLIALAAAAFPARRAAKVDPVVALRSE